MDQNSNSNVTGIILMVVAMGIFAITDTLIKLASGTISPPQVMFLLLGGGMVMFFIIAKLQGARLMDRRILAPVLIVRYLAETAAMVGMVLALTYVPLSTIGAIIQATPLLVTLGAVLFLGEKVSWRRWSAIALGFVGVLMIVQPGAAGYDATTLWAVLAMIGLSIRDLTTRLTPPDMRSASLATYTMAATLPFSIIWIFLDGGNFLPAEANWIIIISMIIMGALGYMMIIFSIRMTEISIVSPFRYSRLIFMIILGMVVFNERPGFLMLAGALLIVVSGLYMMWRERIAKPPANSEQV